MEFKIGDKVVCKTFPKKVNGNIVNSDPNITIDNTYIITELGQPVMNKFGVTKLRMLTIMGENGLCSYWSDYFYDTTELRKIKIEKIRNKIYG